MGLDISTLWQTLGGVLLVCVPALAITYRQNPREQGTRSWAIGSACGAAAVLIFATYGADPRLTFMDMVGTYASWASMLFFLIGSREHLRLRPVVPPWVVLLWGVTVPIAAWGSVALPERGLQFRATTGSIVLCLESMAIAWSFLRELRGSPTARLLALAFGSTGAVHGVRGVLTLVDAPSDFYDRPVDELVVMGSILIATSSAVGFSMLCTEGLIRERESRARALESGVGALGSVFGRFAAGDRSVRVGEGAVGPVGAVGALFDSTAGAVTQAFEQAERQGRLLAATLESLLDGVMLLDDAGRIVRHNGAASTLLGRPPVSLVRQPVDGLLAPGQEAVLVRVHGLGPGEALRAQRVRWALPDGAVIDLLVHASRLRGSALGRVLVLHDDRELAEARGQLQVADRLAAIGTVAAGAAHEINNPLAVVIANLDFALEELRARSEDLEARSEIIEALKAAQGGSSRVRQVVRDLKAFSRADDEGVGSVDANAVVERTLAMMRNELRHHAMVSLDLGPDLPLVRANEPQLGQVLLALLHNAAQAIPPGHAGENAVSVATVRDGGGVRIIVSDTGVGIPPEVASRVYDPFFTTKHGGEGASGLGLTLCQRVLGELGGSIRHGPRAGGGTDFHVWVPVAADPS